MEQVKQVHHFSFLRQNLCSGWIDRTPGLTLILFLHINLNKILLSNQGTSSLSYRFRSWIFWMDLDWARLMWRHYHMMLVLICFYSLGTLRISLMRNGDDTKTLLLPTGSKINNRQALVQINCLTGYFLSGMLRNTRLLNVLNCNERIIFPWLLFNYLYKKICKVTLG